MRKKIIDSNSTISYAGRADQYAASHSLRLKHAKDVVGGADDGIDPFVIIDRYYLKGFEYGNWVSNNDRYDHLIAAQNSLKNLTKILGSDNIGINQRVGIAFGARGMSAAAAHYEPAHNMINLTKARGAGCLAHEYGHALDYNLGSFVDQNKWYAALSGGWHTAQVLGDNVGGQLRAMVNAVVDAVIQTPSHHTLRTKVTGDYWIRRTEIFARFFEQYICYKMRKIGKDEYLTLSWEYYTKGKYSSKYYLKENEFARLLPLGDELCVEIGKFLRGDGKLVVTPYPIGKHLKRVANPIKEKKAAAHPKDLSGKFADKHHKVEQVTTKKILSFQTADADYKPTADYNGRSWYKDLNKRYSDCGFGTEARKAIAVLQSQAKKRNLSELSKQTGLTERHLNTIYKICATEKTDAFRPVLHGIFFDSAGYAVATDGQILVVAKCRVPKTLANKIILPDGQEQIGRFPSWRAVIDRSTPYVRTCRTDENINVLKHSKYTDSELEHIEKEYPAFYGAAKLGTLCRFKNSWLIVRYVAYVYGFMKQSGSVFDVFESDNINQAVLCQIGDKALALVMPICQSEDDDKLLSKCVPRLK